jgi:hypothetical protein
MQTQKKILYTLVLFVAGGALVFAYLWNENRISYNQSKAAGQQFFVSPTGSASGNGSINSPWDLQTALNHPSAVQPGDTIWVRGGTYTGNYSASLVGTNNAPIIVRNYNGERAILDNPSDCDNNIGGEYTWYWGLEFMSSGTDRRTENAGSACGDNELDRGVAFKNWGKHLKVINSIMHDNQIGVGSWGFPTSFPGLEIYGTLIYHNGAEQTYVNRNGWGIGHGLYMISYSNGHVTIRDNIVHSNANTGIRFDWDVYNPHIEGNISYNNGDMYSNGGRNIFVNGAPLTGVVIKNNYTYYGNARISSAGPGNIGASEGAHPGMWQENGSGEITNNYFIGPFPGAGMSAGQVGAPFLLGYWDHFQPTSCGGNTIAGPNVRDYVKQKCQSPANTYSDGRPTANTVIVRPNQYEQGRANIAIYNWQMQPSVSVNLSNAGLNIGQSFVIKDASNFFGNPVASGTYNGGSVSIPMTGLVRAPMVAESDISPQYRPVSHTAPEFGAFIVLPTSGGGTPPPPPPPPASCSVGTNAFIGCYYNNSDFTAHALTRTDNTVNFDWGTGSPDPSISPDSFSVKWEGTFTFESGNYDFSVTADDGVRLYVDNNLIINQWIDQAPTTYTATRAMTAGTHTIKVEYYENGAGAVAQASWVKQAVTPPPPPAPVPPPSPITARKTPNPISINGTLESAWSQTNSISFSNASQSDNQVIVKALWDDTKLYLSYDVTDDVREATNAALWQDDGAEVFIDTQNNKSTSMDANDFQFLSNINNINSLAGVASFTTQRSNGYTMEISVPWSTLSVTPAQNMNLGILFANNDRDNGVATQFDWLNLIATGDYAQPDLWGTLTLGSTIVVANQTPSGNFDEIRLSDGVIRGWTFDPDSSSISNQVHIYIDGPAGGGGTLLSGFTTNVLRSDVNATHGITGNHGFEYTIPSQYRNNQPHTIYVYGIDTSSPTISTLLSGSPKSFTLGSSLVGDINNDCIVNSLDFSLMNQRWLTNDPAADFNKDGLVNTIDYSLLSANWFRGC